MRSILYSMIAAALLVGCTREVEQKPDEVRPVRVLRVGAADGGRRLELAGEVRARYETRLGFRVGGKISQRMVDVGSKVRAGKPLARLDPADLALGEVAARAQEASIEKERDLAAAELARFRDLREKNFISQAEFDRRATALATAEARLEAARAQRLQLANQTGYTVLTADTAGVVTAVDAEAGQVVAAGQTVLRVVRPGEKEVAFAVPEAHRAMLERASALSATLTALPGRSWQARLRELAPAADPVTRTFAARATIVDAGDEVELGMSARLEAMVQGEASILVPVAAIYSRGDQPQVMLVDADGTVRPQPVKTAGILHERVVIDSGLKPGDVVVAAGAQLLRPGQRVLVIDGP